MNDVFNLNAFLMWIENASFIYMSGFLKGKRREFRVTTDGRYKVLLNGRTLYFGDDAKQAGEIYVNAFSEKAEAAGK